MKFHVLIFLSLLAAISAPASTFVGNGGNAGDVELQVATKEIQEALHFIHVNRDNSRSKLCECSTILMGHPICDTLRRLTEPQVQFCAQYLRDNAQNLASSLSSASIGWSRDSIEVQEGGQLRAADAVTDASQKQITVNQGRFLDLKDYERVFLLTHEVGHLQSVQNKPIQDRQTVGPFQSADGGREFLNAIAAATVMEGLDAGVFKNYEPALKRSKGYKKHWFEFSVLTIQGQNETYGVARTNGAAFSYRYQFAGPLGVAIESRATSGTDRYLTSTKSEETTTAWAVKLAYQLYPFSDPMKIFGQSHFLLAAGVERLSGHFKTGDGFVEATNDISSTAPVVDLSYYFPFRRGFWAFARVGYLGHRYEYQIPYRKIEFNPQTLTSLGVSYGF
jgi:hypothetical protein